MVKVLAYLYRYALAQLCHYTVCIDRFTTDETEYYGPFNTLLSSFFPSTEKYQVAPQLESIKGSTYFTVFYIKKGKFPIFLLEIKTYLAFDQDSSRKEADDQMRDRFLEFASHLALPKLYGISALGTHFSVYKYHPQTRRLTPRRILPHPDIFNDIAPQERWNYDVMEPEGEAKLKQLVSEIKKMAAASAENGKRYFFPVIPVLMHKHRVPGCIILLS